MEGLFLFLKKRGEGGLQRESRPVGWTSKGDADHPTEGHWSGSRGGTPRQWRRAAGCLADLACTCSLAFVSSSVQWE